MTMEMKRNPGFELSVMVKERGCLIEKKYPRVDHQRRRRIRFAAFLSMGTFGVSAEEGWIRG